MNSTSRNLLGGLAGAVVLNLIHQTVKQFDSRAPRVDLLGEEAIVKGMQWAGLTPPSGNKLFAVTLAGDLISNAAWFSLIGTGDRRQLYARGLAAGLLAGIGAVVLPKHMGLRQSPVTRTKKTAILTVCWYISGGLAAAAAIRALDK